MTRPKKPKAPRRTVEPESGKKHSELLPEDRQVKLGVKYVCFGCNSRFYDLNKPEPLCPKCGKDQRLKPKTPSPAPPPPSPKKAVPRPMPLLDDDEVEVAPFGEDVEINVENLEAADELFEETDADAVEGPEDDVEEP